MVQNITKSHSGTRWAIGDIHGCANTFKKLVRDVLMLNKDDQLFLLGDYIDKGKHANEVLDFILELQNDGFSIFPIRGNHEEDFLNAWKEYDSATFELYVTRLCKNKNLTHDGVPKKEYATLLLNMPYAIETEDYILAHAAVLPGPDFSDTSYMLHQYKLELTSAELQGKVLLRGHQPTPLVEIEEAIQTRKTVIPLDNGCVYSGKKSKKKPIEGLGKLVAFNMNTRELCWQENID